MTSSGDYDFDLPPELIAQEPATTREWSRLLVITRGGGVADERRFADLPDLLRPGDLLVLNDSRVLPARLQTVREETGGRVEIFLIAPEADDAAAAPAWRALARPSKRLRPGTALAVRAPGSETSAGPRLTVVATHADGEVTVRADAQDLAAVAEAWGEVPLPPYIHRDPAASGAGERRERDRERYQTVYARDDRAGAGSVAAPTAGLHFSPPLLAALASRGVATARVTLHVGPGTFRAPTAQDVARRRLHPERFEYPAATDAAVRAAREGRGRVFAVGTTSLRVLATVAGLGLPPAAAVGTERAYGGAPGADPVFQGRAAREDDGWRVAGTTRLFLRPPDRIEAADGLLTNFHLPGSSLLMLVAAFAGEGWRDAYATAVARGLRFYSYGDAMLILPLVGAEPTS